MKKKDVKKLKEILKHRDIHLTNLVIDELTRKRGKV